MSTAKPDKDGYWRATEDRQAFVATGPGFYASNRQHVGDTFIVREKGEKFKWARPVGAQAADTEADPLRELLDKEAKDILPAIAGFSDADLNSLVGAETSGRRRKGVIAAIEDELANRVGKLAGADPLLS